MKQINVVTLRNSERDLHRIYVVFNGINSYEGEDDYLSELFQIRDWFYQCYKGKYSKKGCLLLEREFEAKKGSSTGKQSFVIQLKKMATEDCKMFAGMVISSFGTWFSLVEHVPYKIGKINLDFPDVYSEKDKAYEIMKIV